MERGPAREAAPAGQQVTSSGTPDAQVRAKKSVDKTPSTPGLEFSRYFTLPGVDPFDEVEWEIRSAVIGNEKGKVEVDEQKHPVGRGAFAGGVIGAIFGTAFLIPVAGAAAGAAIGAMFGHGQKGGAEDFKSFTESVKKEIPNGGAAVILLGHTEARDRVINDLGKHGGN